MDFGSDTLGLAVGWSSLVLGAGALVVGLAMAWNQRKATPPPPPEPAALAEQGGIKDVLDGAADFAKALKDLDRAAQLFSVGVLLIAIAAIVAGLDNVAQAIASTAQ